MCKGKSHMKISKRRMEMGEVAWAEYQKNRNSEKTTMYAARNVERVVDWRRNTKRKLIEYKGGKCEICNYCKDVPSAYDFHHIDPSQKEFNISGKGIPRKLELLKKEVDKCKLLCKVCHAELHENLYIESREKTKLRYMERLEYKKTIMLEKEKEKEKVIKPIQEKLQRNKYRYSISERKCKFCEILFKPKLDRINYCSVNCFSKSRITSNKPSLEELKKLIWKIPSTKIADIYKVSDVTIMDWALDYGLEKPPRGYWARKK